MNQSTTPSFQYHSSIHRDEEIFSDLIQTEFFTTQTQINEKNEMTLSANINQFTEFSICRVDRSNYNYYTALFSELENEALTSNHSVIFEGLDDISGPVFGFNGL